MRHPILFSLCAAGVIALTSCGKPDNKAADRKFEGVNVVDESNLNDVMLTVADPN